MTHKIGDEVIISYNVGGYLHSPHKGKHGKIIEKHDTRGMRYGSLSYDVKLDNGEIIKGFRTRDLEKGYSLKNYRLEKHMLPKGTESMERSK